MKAKAEAGIHLLVERLRKDQMHDGSWRYPFETGITTDCYMIILLRTLEFNEEKLIKQLAERILSRQQENGAWKLFEDEGAGNLTATLEAYYALLYSGHADKLDKRMIAARRFILGNGGPGAAHMFTKIMLALTGQQKWPSFFPFPIELMLLPVSFPINMYEFSVFGRANIIPIMVAADRKFQMKTDKSPDLADLGFTRGDDFFKADEYRLLHSVFDDAVKRLAGFPAALNHLAHQKAVDYMIKRLEGDGTFYSYFSSTFLMIFALLAVGYPKTHRIIVGAVEGLKGMMANIDGHVHMQYTDASVWNTSLISYALQESGVPRDDEMVLNANRYLLDRQHVKYGDWAIHSPEALPGGWGFSDENTMVPDVDDTTASLRAISGLVHYQADYKFAWKRGVQWILNLQNKDGGWPAFEKNTNSRLLSLAPIDKAEFLLADPPAGDLTGRTLEFLGKWTNLPRSDPAVKKGIKWLHKNQKKDGSWYGRWGVCYIYGTWASLTGMLACGESQNHPAVKKAVKWLKSIQHKDGGWGESCKSDSAKEYVSLGESTLTDTAWAVDALIAAEGVEDEAAERGIAFILKNLDSTRWTEDYPKGQGMAGDFYIHYHGYRYIFPLMALAHYVKKKG